MHEIHVLTTDLMKKLSPIVEGYTGTPIQKLLQFTSDLEDGTLNLSNETISELKEVIQNNSEALLLYFATNCNRSVTIVTPINDQLELVSYTATTTNYNDLQSTYLRHRESHTSFDLTYVDAYQESDDDDDETLHYLTSYLYGDAESKDWTERRRTRFDDIYQNVERIFL